MAVQAGVPLQLAQYTVAIGNAEWLLLIDKLRTNFNVLRDISSKVKLRQLRRSSVKFCLFGFGLQ